MTYGEDGSFNAAYTYGLERIEVEAVDETRPESQDPLYYLYDGLGSVTFMVKPDGNWRDHYRYDEFGKPAPGNSKLSEDGSINLHNTFGYTGEMWDEESELLYLRARYYEPETGRFLSRDTYEGELENPLSKHLYAYVENNPVNHVDPTGHIPYVAYNNGFYYFVPDNILGDIAYQVASAASPIGFGNYIMNAALSLVNLEPITDEEIEKIEGTLEDILDLTADADKLKLLPKGNNIGLFADKIAWSIGSIKVLAELTREEDRFYNQIVWSFFKEQLVSTSKQSVITMFAYAKSRVIALWESGEIRYVTGDFGEQLIQFWDWNTYLQLSKELEDIDLALWYLD